MATQTSNGNNNGNNVQSNGKSRQSDKVDKFGFLVDKLGDAHEKLPTFAESKRTERRTKKWDTMMQSWESFRRRRNRLIITRLRKGLPDNQRGKVWALLGDVKNNMEVKHVGLYQKLVASSADAAVHKNSDTADGDKNGSGHENNNPESDEKGSSTTNNSKSLQYIQEVIERDIPRTYPRHSMFFEVEEEEEEPIKNEGEVLDALCNQETSCMIQENLDGYNNSDQKEIQKKLASGVGGQAALRRVLNAYNYYDREIGYCQGMNFITGMFLTIMPEEETFWLLVAIMKEPPCQMRGLFSEGMSETHKVLHIAEKLIHQFLPKLAKHFDKENIHVTMFVTQWLLTQYTSSFKFDLVFRVWDAFLAEGWKVTYRVMLAILQFFQPTLLKMSFEEILNFFRELPSKVEGAAIMDIANKIPLKRKHIQKYEQEWQSQQQSQR